MTNNVFSGTLNPTQSINRAPIANPPNSAQLQGTPTIPQVTSGSMQ